MLDRRLVVDLRGDVPSPPPQCGPFISFLHRSLTSQEKYDTPVRARVNAMGSLPKSEIKRIAIIGAGPAGVAAAK